MKITWIEELAYGFEVERFDPTGKITYEITRPMNRPYIPIIETHKGVMHTTQGPSLRGAFTTLSTKRAAPTFLIGENRILQCRPLGVQAAALIDPGNRLAYVQIEACAYTGGEAAAKDEAHHAMDSWMFIESTRKPVAAILAWLDDKGIIPLKRAVASFRDDCKDMKGIPASTKNSRRLSGAYNDPKNVGWFGHSDVPGNSHYDPGALRWAELFAEARKLQGKTD